MKRSTTKRSGIKGKANAARQSKAVILRTPGLRKVFTQHFTEGRGTIGMVSALAKREAAALIRTLELAFATRKPVR